MWGAEPGAGLTVAEETEKSPALLLCTFKSGTVYIFSVLTDKKIVHLKHLLLGELG
jgi:hypothetical protein